MDEHCIEDIELDHFFNPFSNHSYQPVTNIHFKYPDTILPIGIEINTSETLEDFYL